MYGLPVDREFRRCVPAYFGQIPIPNTFVKGGSTALGRIRLGISELAQARGRSLFTPR